MPSIIKNGVEYSSTSNSASNITYNDSKTNIGSSVLQNVIERLCNVLNICSDSIEKSQKYVNFNEEFQTNDGSIDCANGDNTFYMPEPGSLLIKNLEIINANIPITICAGSEKVCIYESLYVTAKTFIVPIQFDGNVELFFTNCKCDLSQILL